MAFLSCTFKSEALGQDVCFHAVIPQAVPDHIRTLYLLHGLSDNHTNWSRMTSVERYAQDANLAVIMPNVDRSFYTDMAYGRNFYTYITQDLISYTRQLFKLSDKREDTFVAGLSMGGYGAFKVAFRRNDLFGAAASLSGVLDINRRFSKDRTWSHDALLAFGDRENLDGSEENLLYLLEKFNDENEPKPRLYQACGTEDFLYENNLTFRAAVKDRGFDYRYEEGPGAHNWAFWDQYIARAIKFFTEGM